MFINFKLLLSAVLLLNLVVPVFSFEPSGGVLCWMVRMTMRSSRLPNMGIFSPEIPMRLLLRCGSIRNLDRSQERQISF